MDPDVDVFDDLAHDALSVEHEGDARGEAEVARDPERVRHPSFGVGEQRERSSCSRANSACEATSWVETPTRATFASV